MSYNYDDDDEQRFVEYVEPPELYALSGYGGSGKDTVAQMLEPFGFQRLAFADPIRDALYVLNPLLETVKLADEVDRLGWDVAKRTHPEIRGLLQRFGTEVGRNLFGENFWVDQTLGQIEYGKRYVITDCRFINEVKAIKEIGGKILRVERKGVGPANEHISEIGLDGYNFNGYILNDGTLDDLKIEVENSVGVYS